MEGTVICDGRGNAGTGACAAVAYVDDQEVARNAVKLPPVTNIVAEHKSVQLAILLAAENRIDQLTILNDCQTCVYQLDGSFRIHSKHLYPIILETWEMANLPFFLTVDIKWVPREQTKLPDKLCRLVDTRYIPPDMSMEEFKDPNAPKRISRRRKRLVAAEERKRRPNPFK